MHNLRQKERLKAHGDRQPHHQRSSRGRGYSPNNSFRSQQQIPDFPQFPPPPPINTPHQRPNFNATQQQDNANKSLCRDFQTGTCQRGDNCRFEHKCGTCNKFGHGSSQCRGGGKGDKNGKSGKGGKGGQGKGGRGKGGKNKSSR